MVKVLVFQKSTQRDQQYQKPYRNAIAVALLGKEAIEIVSSVVFLMEKVLAFLKGAQRVQLHHQKIPFLNALDAKQSGQQDQANVTSVENHGVMKIMAPKGDQEILKSPSLLPLVQSLLLLPSYRNVVDVGHGVSWHRINVPSVANLLNPAIIMVAPVQLAATKRMVLDSLVLNIPPKTSYRNVLVVARLGSCRLINVLSVPNLLPMKIMVAKRQ